MADLGHLSDEDLLKIAAADEKLGDISKASNEELLAASGVDPNGYSSCSP